MFQNTTWTSLLTPKEHAHHNVFIKQWINFGVLGQNDHNFASNHSLIVFGQLNGIGSEEVPNEISFSSEWLVVSKSWLACHGSSCLMTGKWLADDCSNSNGSIAKKKIRLLRFSLSISILNFSVRFHRFFEIQLNGYLDKDAGARMVKLTTKVSKVWILNSSYMI